ncbi:MAG TPA: hypothetical protein PLV92_23855, partial [Pirellulaceae bacterium]|nr:hypothetical protein [Pirellulaceae bacterium]
MAIRGLQPSLQQQIGYHIPPRSLGVTILGAYCGVLLVGGGWLARRGRLDSLAWLVPAATVVVTIVLFGVGAANTSSVPATIALTELWRVNPNTNETRLDGLAAYYDQQTRDIVWQSEGGTWVLPDPQPDSEIRRLVWNDGNAFETQNATTRAGSVGIASLNGHRPLSSRISAVATFGPAGLEGRLESGGLEGVTDPVLIVPPTMAGAVTMKPDGSFSSGSDQILPADQYMAESLLNDEQQRRHGVYRWLFNPSDNWSFPRQPSFVFWSKRGDDGLKLPTGFEVSGSSIVVVPVTLQRCLPGAEFQIPPTFLRAEVSAGRAGMSTAFNPRSGQWVTGLTAQNETVLRFVLPSEVLPCELVRGELSVRINAPSRDVSIWTGDPKSPISLMQRRNPNGVLTFPLTAEHLVLDERNGVKIGIEIGPTEKQRAQAATEQERMKRAREGQAPLPIDPKADASQQFDNSTWQV